MKPLAESLITPRSNLSVNRWSRFVARFDWPLFIGMVLIIAIGLLNLYSATYRTHHTGKFDQQVVWTLLGSGIFFAVSFLDYKNLLRLAWIILGLAIATVMAVLIIGQVKKGAQRWIGLGPVRIQPSELVKIAVILAFARLLQDGVSAGMSRRTLALRALLLASPVLLVAMQPDLGTAILVSLIMLSIGFMCLSNVLPLTIATLSGLAIIPIIWDHLHGYQKQRILCFLDPQADPTGACWHAQQSIYAVGSGRVTGKGFMEGTQNQFSFLPEQWTDFPFSVLAEEWGFLGSALVLMLYCFLVFWIINTAFASRDKFGSAICVGVAAMLFWHVVVNIAMVLGAAPVVGVTLPLISYGGSSMISFFLALGLVSSVSMRRHGY